MRMLNFGYIAFILTTSLLLSCGSSKKIGVHSVKGLELITLHASNLSEDMNATASQNDEILLLAYFVQQADTFSILQEQSFVFTFDSLRMTHPMNHKIFPLQKDKQLLVFVLIEMDNENTKIEIESTMRKYIQSGIFLKAVDKLAIDKLLPYDDFLGLKYIPSKDLSVLNKVSIEFSGRHLFDKYHYLIEAKTY